MNATNPFLGFSPTAINELFRLNMEQLRITEKAITQQRGTESEPYWIRQRTFLLAQGEQLIQAI